MKKIAAALFTIGCLLMVVMAHAQEVPSSDKLLTDAYAIASKENKNVLVIFHASWCGWCKKMDAAINDTSCKALFEKSYVIVHLTVEESKENRQLENPGANMLKRKYKGDNAGLPFWLILNSKGDLLGDSFMRKPGESLNVPGENIGCPAATEEVAAFCSLLKKTSSLSEAELAVISSRFKKNK